MMQVDTLPHTGPATAQASLGPLGPLVAVIGHELRNPLAAAIVGLAAAAEMTEVSDPRSSFLRRALGDLDRVSDLLNRYLEFGRTGKLRTEPVDLGGLVTRLAQRYGGRVVVSTETEDIVVQGDRSLLERALENLVDNAFEAGATEVRLGAERAGDGALLEVIDDGPGIAQELRERIFEPFVSGRGSNGLLGSHVRFEEGQQEELAKCVAPELCPILSQARGHLRQLDDGRLLACDVLLRMKDLFRGLGRSVVGLVDELPSTGLTIQSKDELKTLDVGEPKGPLDEMRSRVECLCGLGKGSVPHRLALRLIELLELIYPLCYSRVPLGKGPKGPAPVGVVFQLL